MRKTVIGIAVGFIVALIDITPMLIQSLPLSAVISAFLTWVIICFFIATSEIKINPIIKGIVIALTVLLSSAPLIGAHDWKVLLVPIFPTTVVLGALSGWLINKLLKKYS